MTAITVRWYDELLAVGLAPADSDSARVDGNAPIHGMLFTAAGMTLLFSYRHAENVGPEVRVEGPFRALTVPGPLDFSLTGILVSLLTPLAQADISVFTLSTFDTDWILVPVGSTGAATQALIEAGHTVMTEEHG